mmetsp:Transcript_17223/g.51416  ORF Transcript_17223/g.51416 Transcript_17223/m.51416 type:complete len:328 (-) Transcript_17223:21-1004(-)
MRQLSSSWDERRGLRPTLARTHTVSWREWCDEFNPRACLRRLAFASAAIAAVILVGGLSITALEEQFDLREGLFYALFVFSTLGPGRGPETSGGRLFTVSYSLVTFVLAPVLLNICANQFSRLFLCALGSCLPKLRLTSDPTLRRQRRLGIAVFLFFAHVAVNGGVGFHYFMGVDYEEAIYYSYMALSTIALTREFPRSDAGLAFSFFYILSGMGLLTLIAEDLFELYRIYRDHVVHEQECDHHTMDGSRRRMYTRSISSCDNPGTPVTGWVKVVMTGLFNVLSELPRQPGKVSSFVVSVLSPIHRADSDSSDADLSDTRHPDFVTT